MKFAVVLYLSLGGVLSQGNRCNNYIDRLNRNLNRLVATCSDELACGPPEPLANAMVDFTSTTLTSTATYTCEAGFSFVGLSQEVECGSLATWSDILGTCVVDCESPPDVVRAQVIYQDTTVGAVATYVCEGDSELKEATCDATGMWTPVPDCEIDCGPPEPLANATVDFTSTTLTSTATYTCEEGFSFVGLSQEVECGSLATWSDILGTCVVDCESPPDVVRAQVIYQDTTVGAVATYVCEGDSELKEATCDATGMWTPVPDCEIDCGPPEPLANATVDFTSTTLTSTATYTCEEGFSFVGLSQEVECGLFETWSDILGTCVVDCESPPDVVRAQVIYQDTTVGAVATYICEDIFAVKEATCDETGMWSPVPECVIDCPRTPDVFCTGVDVVMESSFQAVATYTCDAPGYVFNGSNQAVCSIDGMWTPVVEPCVCTNLTDQFELFPNKIIDGLNNRIFNGITEVEVCRSICLNAGFVCRSFEFIQNLNRCLISDIVGICYGLSDNAVTDFYERICEE